MSDAGRRREAASLPPLIVRGLLRVARAAVVPVAALLALACQATDAAGPATAGGEGLPRRVALDVRGRPQARNLSCESRSACDLLGHLGHRVPEEAFLAGLPRSDNPEHGFVGDVDGPSGQLPPAGYGVHAPPVAARLRALGHDAHAHRGVDLGWLRRQLAAGRPVIVWATAYLDTPAPVRMQDAAGRAFLAVRGEHTFLAVGYGGGRLHLLDPAVGEVEVVPAARFDAAWAVLGRQAVVVGGPPTAPTAGAVSADGS